MKKISTLIVASLLTMSLFAADRKPTVTIQASKKYEVVIDGKSYLSGNISSMTVASLRNGYHTVTVYSTARGRGFFFKKSKQVISTTSFMLRNNDIIISVDMFGKVQIKELKMGKDRDDRGWDQKDRDNGFGKDARNDKNDHNKRF